jgi:hypothetical protein
MGGRVDLGPAFQRQGECYLPNERTNACAEGTRTLLAIRPWADAVDLQMFLMGFDAGEKYGISHQAYPDQNNLNTLPNPTIPQEP